MTTKCLSLESIVYSSLASPCKQANYQQLPATTSCIKFKNSVTQLQLHQQISTSPSHTTFSMLNIYMIIQYHMQSSLFHIVSVYHKHTEFQQPQLHCVRAAMGYHPLCRSPPSADPESMHVAAPWPALQAGDADVPHCEPPRHQQWTLLL